MPFDECLEFNSACIESRQEFRRLILSPSRDPLLGCRRNPTASATKKRKAEDISPPSPATCLTESSTASTQGCIEYVEERHDEDMEDVFDDRKDVDLM